jgi:hypothetical protein
VESFFITELRTIFFVVVQVIKYISEFVLIGHFDLIGNDSSRFMKVLYPQSAESSVKNSKLFI